MLTDSETHAWLADQRARGIKHPGIYRSVVRWREFSGYVGEASSEYHESMEAAKKEAQERAAVLGWTEAKWWQFWRWGERKPRTPQNNLLGPLFSAD